MLLSKTINVMIVNDSRLILGLLSDLVSNHEIKVTEQAQDGTQALRMIKQNRPDVILLDLEMPHMDGLAFLEQLMKETPIPVIAVSSYVRRNAAILFDALDRGAVDFFTIPMVNPEKIYKIKSILISKIKTAARSKPQIVSYVSNTINDKIDKRILSRSDKLVVIGASTGGPGIVSKIMAELPSDLKASIIVVQHMPETFTKYFASRLNELSPLCVREANKGDEIVKGTALVAPGNKHLVIKSPFVVSLNNGPKRMGVRPSVNMTMISASELYRNKTIGVLLSGMGQDGAFGMKMIKQRGGITIAQDKDSSVVFGMAKSAQDLGVVDKVLPADKLAQEIIRVVDSNE